MSAIKKIGIIVFLLAMTAMRGALPAYGSGTVSYAVGAKQVSAEKEKQVAGQATWIGRSEDEQEYRQPQTDVPFEVMPAAVLLSLFTISWGLLSARLRQVLVNTYTSYPSRPYYLLFHSLRIPGNHRM